MVNSESEGIVVLSYRDDRFRFVARERTEHSLSGWFLWTDEEKAELLALEQEEDAAGKQPWYLDNDGYRLDDEMLFTNSPWCIIDGGKCEKVVQRFMNWDTGDATFCLAPWFRIGDELNSRPCQ